MHDILEHLKQCSYGQKGQDSYRYTWIAGIDKWIFDLFLFEEGILYYNRHDDHVKAYQAEEAFLELKWWELFAFDEVDCITHVIKLYIKQINNIIK